MRKLVFLAFGLALVACSHQEPEQVGSTGPTVTYRYFGDANGDQLQEAIDKADAFCSDKYDQKAMLLKVDREDGGNVATFQCAST
jgi:hypothetical protein